MSTEVRAKNIKPGMVLLDSETGKPVAEVDHKMAAVRGTGNVRFLVLDLEAGRYVETQIFATAMVKVA